MAEKDDNFASGMIQPSLIDGLKNILDQYPDDNQILKELIQNAEDAGARKVIFLYDTTQYGTTKLHHQGLADYQGAALYAYNDAEFSAEDWLGIRMIQNSVKKKDPMRVGRFGLGFKSVFHMTDLVGILSGDQVGYLDPHETFFRTTIPGKTRDQATSSYSWKLNSEELQAESDQFEPFRQSLFGKNKDYVSHFPGTVFRFPLRQRGDLSLISDTLYTDVKIRKLFDMFEKEAHSFLLFLSNIEKIEIYFKDNPNKKPKRIHSVKIDGDLKHIREQRTSFRQTISTGRWLAMPFHVTFPMKTVKITQSVTSTKSWLITHYFEGGLHSKLKQIMENGKTKMLPWAGICLPLDTDLEDTPGGQIFCFLPLPTERRSTTGFHFHVHGYFAVDQNRQHLKWPSADQNLQSLSDESLSWNKDMVEEALPHALTSMVKYCIAHSAALKMNVQSIYRLFPDTAHLVSHWHHLATPFYQSIKAENIYFTEDKPGEWIDYRRAKILEEGERQNEVISKILRRSSKRSNLTIPPRHILDKVAPLSPTQVSPDYLSTFAATLNLGVKLAQNERRQLVEYLSRHQRDIQYLKPLLLAEKQNGELGSFGEELFLDSGDSGMDLKDLVHGLKHKFFVSIATTDSYYSVLSRIANSGLTGLKLVRVEQVPELLNEMCQNIGQPVKLKPTVISSGVTFTPTKLWHKKVWKFIERHSDQVQLDKYHGLPLLRSDNELYPFHNREPYLSRTSRHATLPPDVINILQQLGCIIIDDTPSVVHEYVANADPNGVLEAFEKNQHIEQSISKLKQTDKQRLREFLATADTRKYRLLLLKLPIFETMPTLSDRNRNSTEASRTKFCSTYASTLPVPLPADVIMIDAADDNIKQFLLKLGLESMTDTQIYHQHILPAFETYSPPQKRTLIEHIMEEFERHNSNSSGFTQCIQPLKCIPTTQGSLQQPQDIFDPNDNKLQTLFGNSNIIPFPVDTFRTDIMLSRLRQLGISGSKHVSADHLVKLATQIHNQVHSTRKVVLATSFVSFLNDHVSVLQQAKEQLQNLVFIPVQRRRPYSYPKAVPWKGENQPLTTPKLLSSRPMLVGSQCAPPGGTYLEMERIFNWDADPPLEMVVKHFKSVITSHEAGQQAPPMLFEIYKFLNETMTQETIHFLSEIGQWVWCTSTFVHPKNATFDQHLRIKTEPYMYICGLSGFANLLSLAGVESTVSYTSILQQINNEHSSKKLSEEEVSRDHEIVMAIVQHISSTIQNRSDVEIPSDMLLPVSTNPGELLLKPIEQCTFCDSESFFHSQQNEVEELFIVHPDISEQTAKLFQVPSFMSRYLDADEMDMSFGQSERLTLRLNNILRDYKDGSAVLKELIQNADDAKASEVAFIYDKRDFSTQERQSLLDESMRGMNGPAIWSYNNSVFSPSDYANIVKLSGATKEADETKIGQFGLGFNAVYNLTDVPSFISRRTIVFFDPHIKYLRNCIKDKSKPGLKLDLGKSSHRMKTFQDQFKPYCGLFGWTMENDFNGTLFRFPLRTHEQASESEISSKAYTEKDVIQLFELFKENAESMLLFAQNVNRVTVSILDDVGSKPVPKPWFTVERKIEKVFKQMMPRQSIKQNLEEETRILQMTKYINRSHDNRDAHSNSYILELSITDHQKEAANQTKRETNKTKSIKHENKSKWFIYNCIGSDEAAEQAKSKKGLQPVGGIAAKIQLNKHSEYQVKPLKKDQGLFFCFLPLPIQSHLSVHINGFFALHQSRTRLEEKELGAAENERAKWNIALMEDAVCKAHVGFLEHMTKAAEHRFDADYIRANIFDLYPIHTNHNSGVLFCLKRMFLKDVFCKHGSSLLPSKTTWINSERLKMLDGSLNQSKIRALCTKVCDEILNSNRKAECFVDVQSSVHLQLDNCDLTRELGDKLITPDIFFKDIFLPNVSALNVSDVEALILHCLTKCNQRYDNILTATACIPVTSKGGEYQFQYPNNLVDPQSKHLADLFQDDDGYFPNALLRKEYSWRNGLKRLGMRSSDLRSKEIVERANTIQHLDQPQAERRSKCLMALLRDARRVSDEQIEEVKSKLLQTNMIPVMQRPKKWELPWFTSGNNPLLTLRECYVEDCSFLGSVIPIPMNDSNIPEVLQRMDAERYIDAGLMVKQLKVLHDILPDSNQTLQLQIQENACSCYVWCNEKCTNGEDDLIVKHVCNFKFIFVPSRTDQPVFVEANRCAERATVACEPLLYRLPEYFRFKELMRALEIPRAFSPEQYVTELQNAHSKYANNPVPESELRPILSVVRGLSNELDEKESRNKLDPIYLPDIHSVLRESTTLNFNEIDWLGHDESNYMCHSKISNFTAKLLGVQRLNDSILNDSSFGADFGQSEDLKDRIKGIMDEYPRDKEILKEFLQNADDAKASEIHFVLDVRHHNKTKLFSGNWKHLQGPALLVYNDKPFSQQDLKGIQNLGKGSKGDDAVTTGKYGVGFNCIYHITDTPTFLTNGNEVGKKLCAFDPQCRYVPMSNKTHPGRMWNVDKKLSQYEDVFHCYNIKGLNNPESTLFRFPLRSPQVASTSCFGHTIGCQEIMELFEKFQEDMAIMLLFLSNVRKITLSRIENDGTMRTIANVSAKLTEKGEEEKCNYIKAMNVAAQRLKENTWQLQDVPATEASYHMEITSHDRTKQRWIVCQRIGFSQGEVENSVQLLYKESRAAVLPRGGVARLIDKHMLDEPESQPRTKRRRPDPVNQDSDAESKDPKYRLFCFLPLPKESEFPMHVNGHFILSSASRHDIYEANEVSTFKSQWNELLLTTVIAKAYVTAMEKIKHNIPPGVLAYSSIKPATDKFIATFPENPVQEIRRALRCLQKSIYSNILRGPHHLFPVIERQTPSLNKGQIAMSEMVSLKWKTSDNQDDPFYFNDLDVQFTIEPNDLSIQPYIDPACPILQDALLNCKFPLTILPCQFKDRFEESMDNLEDHCTIRTVNSTAVVLFLKKHKAIGFPHLPCEVMVTPFLNPTAVKTVFDYMKKSKSFSVHKSGLPILLTKDNTLREMSDTMKPILATSFSSLVPTSPHHFIHDVFGTFEFQCKDVSEKLSPFVKQMDIADFAAILHEFLDKSTFCSAVEVPLSPPVTMEWLDKLYEFIYMQTFKPVKVGERGEKRFQEGNLQLLNEWCIVPVTTPEKDSLYRLKDANKVLCPYKYNILALANLDLPRLKTSNKNTSNWMQDVFLELGASTAKPGNLLIALSNGLHKTAVQHISKGDATSFLEFFAQHVEDIVHMPQALNLTKQLPFFITCSGNITSVYGFSNVVVIPNRVEKSGVDKLQRANTIYLRQNYGLESLYTYLGFSFPSFVEAYENHILPNIQNLNQSEIEAQIRCVRYYVDSKREDEENARNRLINKLKLTPFLRRSNGNFHRACDFYDPNNKVFDAMQSEDDFPPSPFHSQDWIYFLKRIGLKYEVSDQMLIKYATEIALGKHNADKCSQILVADLFQRFDSFSNVLYQLRTIAFLPRKHTKDTLLKLADSCKTTKLVSFSMCTTPSKENITWTVLPVLQSWAVPSWEQSRNNLGIICKPSTKQVADHMRLLYTKWKNTLKEKDTQFIENQQDLLLKCLEYLKTICKNESDKQLLVTLPCLLSPNGKFYRANQMVCQIEEQWRDIQPALFLLPRKYYVIEDFLKSIGVTEHITIAQAATVLAELFMRQTKKGLIGKDIANAVIAAKLLFILYEKTQENIAHPNELYFPTDKNTMVKSGEIYVVDVQDIAECKLDNAVPLMVPLDTNDHGDQIIGLQQQKYVIEKLPNAIRPKLLSSLVHEEIVPSCIRDASHRKSLPILEKLNHEEFHGCLLRLARADQTTTSTPKEDRKLLKEIAECLIKFQIIVLKLVRTHKSQNNVVIKNSEKEKVIFVAQRTESSVIIYLREKVAIDDPVVCTDLADEIILAFKPFQNKQQMEKLLPFVLQTNVEEMANLLTRKGIQHYGIPRRTNFLKPGSLVPQDHIPYMKQSISRLDVGDYAAYEVKDPLVDDDIGNARTTEGIYIYVKVLEVIFPPGTDSSTLSPMYFKYRIDMGEKQDTVISALLYRFEDDIEEDEQDRSQSEADPEPETWEEIKEFIRQRLEAAWKLGDERERRVIFKRLALQFHPDKNPHRVKIATEAFQFMQQEIERLERGEPSTTGHSSYSSGTTGTGSWFRRSYGHFRYRARHYYDSTHHSESSHSGSTHSGSTHSGSRRNWRRYRSHGSYTSYTAYSKRANPQPALAQQWLRQAQYDLQAVPRDTAAADSASNAPSVPYEWACYKAYQAMEKATRAVQYYIDARHDSPTHTTLHHCDCYDLRSSFVSEIGSADDMQHPRFSNCCSTPREEFTKEKASRALKLAQQIVQKCTDVIDPPVLQGPARQPDSDEAPPKKKSRSE